MVQTKEKEIDSLISLGKVEFPDELLAIDMVENKMGLNWKEPKEVRAAMNREVRHTPQRNPTTQIWQGNEFPICKAFWETTLSKDLWFSGSISLFFPSQRFFLSFFLYSKSFPHRPFSSSTVLLLTSNNTDSWLIHT